MPQYLAVARATHDEEVGALRHKLALHNIE